MLAAVVRGRDALSLFFRGSSMTPKALTLSKYIARASVVLVFAMGASACSSVPDWVDPTTWVGGSDSDQPVDQGQQAADNNTQTPDLSTIPDKPQTPSTADEQKQVADSLASDRGKAQYSADALRGGTEPAAAAPPADAPPPSEEVAANDNAPAPAAAPAAPPPPPAAGPGTLPADSSSAAAPQPAPAPAPSEPAVASASMPPPAVAQSSSSMPAVPAAGPQVAQMPTGDSSLGFRPSSAPPLDGSVAQFVAPSIMARYQQTASISGGNPAVPATGTAYASNSRHSRNMGMGGPEKMSGAVVANFDALQGAAVAPTAYTGIPGSPSAVVFFPRDTTVLNGEAKAQVREAARAFMARGGQGYVRVVGHASSGASSMTGERQLVWNFERSQARANAVARALIAQGVPADKVLVQAVGDDQSGYGVTAPNGEDGGRRADIIFES
jgi:outer membrane protein OmpA-like peptidoglycan-associated protein